jgi:hypothetical protein
MKRLAVLMDGTWNIPTSDTNVSRLFRLVDVDNRSCDVEQHAAYVVDHLSPHRTDLRWYSLATA